MAKPQLGDKDEKGRFTKGHTSSVVHGMCCTKFYVVWKNIKCRCLNENTPYYKNYGGRGISVCSEWLDFDNFKNDMYSSYLEHVYEFGLGNTQIERKCNDGNYELSNCIWATRKEQNNNQRDKSSQKWFKATSPEKEIFFSNNIRDFADEYDLMQGNIKHCLKGNRNHHREWSFEYSNIIELELIIHKDG